MLRMCVYMHSRFVENHPIRILEDGPFISEGVLSHSTYKNSYIILLIFIGLPIALILLGNLVTI